MKGESALNWPKPILYTQGDKVTDLEVLNSVHDVRGGTVVVHLPPGRVPRQWVTYAILQALGQSYEQIASSEKKTDVHWSHWPIALEIERIVFYPAENLKPDLIRDIHSAAGPIQVWLANRKPAGPEWPGLEVQRGSLESLREASKQRSSLSDPVPALNYLRTSWPEDPLKARFMALGFPILEAGLFSNQFNEAFRASGLITRGKRLSDGALARMIRVLATNARGEVCSGAYCGIWSRMFRQGQVLDNPEMSVLRETLPNIRLPDFHKLTSLDESLVFGLVKSGFSLEEISALRVDQVESTAPRRAMIVGIKVQDDLADVLRCALSRARAFRHGQQLVMTPLIQTGPRRRSKSPDQMTELRLLYRSAAGYFRKQDADYPSHPKSLQTRKKVRLKDAVPTVPSRFVKSELTERDISILREAMEQTDWPDRFARNIVKDDDDLDRLVGGHYLERADLRGIEVDQCVAMSQGFPMTKFAGELLERTHYEVRRASMSSEPPDPSRRQRDLMLVSSALKTEHSPKQCA